MAKNIMYLDQEKMYSISSQIFKGVTEYVLKEDATISDQSETQKGPINSGKILADILREEKKNTEKKYLYDYSYAIFEDYLFEEKKVINITGKSKNISKDEISKYSFIKVSLKAIFNDSLKIQKLIKNFNMLGKSLAYITNYDKLSEAKSQFEKIEKSTKDKNEKNRLKRSYQNNTNITAIAKEAGYYQDEKFLEYLSSLLEYGFQDILEIQQKSNEFLFSSVLNRCFLRESEDIITRKYSRKTEKDIVVFGIITQCSEISSLDLIEDEDMSLKEALMNLVEHFTNIESTFTGRLSNEVVIDPIAIYTEL